MRFCTWYSAMSAAVVLCGMYLLSCGMMAFRPAKALLPCVHLVYAVIWYISRLAETNISDWRYSWGLQTTRVCCGGL